MDPAAFMTTPAPRDASGVEAMVRRSGGLLRALGYLGGGLGLLTALLIAILSEERLPGIGLAVLGATLVGGPFLLAASIGLDRSRRLWRDGTLAAGSLRSAGVSVAASLLANGVAVYDIAVDLELGGRRYRATSSASVDLGRLPGGHPVPVLVLESDPRKVVLCVGLPGCEVLEASCEPV